MFDLIEYPRNQLRISRDVSAEIATT